ncbi:hypothetical protein HDU89_006143 [Geranomyces variabilis]|nr:hypothetical protein HDU89_006143 [Geranomyces variabilis]
MGVFIRLPAPPHTWDEDVIEAALPNVEGVEHVIKRESSQHFAHIHFTSLYHAAIFFRQWGGRGIMINGKHVDVKPDQLNGQPVQYADLGTLVAPEMEEPANPPHRLPCQPAWGSGRVRRLPQLPKTFDAFSPTCVASPRQHKNLKSHRGEKAEKMGQ